MNHIYDVLIIGGGPAGYSAALYATRAGLDTAVIERLSAGGQMTLTDVIENYPGFDDGIDGFSLGMKMQQGAERFGATTLYAEVLSTELNGNIKTVTTDSGDYLSKTVIIASGANAKELGIDGERQYIGKGIHYCAHCDGRFYKDKTVMVVGGGNSAVSDALYLSRLAKKVYLVHRRDTLRASKIYHNQLTGSRNIEILWNCKISEFLADQRITGALVTNLLSQETKTVLCDGIFISIGRKPVTEFLAGQLDCDESGYIIADETTKTNIAGVFAVGDVRTKALRQVVTAVSDGAVAVHFAEEYINAKS